MQLRKPLVVDVPELGRFVFAHRTFRDEMKIQVEVHRILDGETNAPAYLQHFAIMYATLATLTKGAPEGWSIEDLDPLDDASYTRLEEVFVALRDAESAFRGRISGGREGDSEGQGPAD